MIGPFLRLTLRGVTDLRLHPFAQLLTLLAVAMVTLLTGLILLGVHNLDQELLKSRGRVEFQIYWKNSADPAQVNEEWDTIRAMDHLAAFKTFTPANALAELAASLGKTSDFSGLADDNPLPYSGLAAFAVPPEAQREGWAADLLSTLKDMPGVDKVNYTPFQADLAQGWRTLTRTVIWPVLGFLGLVVALVVHNTIKLSLLTRMDEVEILALVGASPSYIRWPLLIGGLIQGILGAGLGLGLLAATHSAMADALNFPPFLIQLQFLPMDQLLILGGAVTLVSVLSSWVAVK
ncbi:cell division protein FtsX [Desulfovibrio sp. Fe33]|uniref:cell division protein FtsX n=1 Tax=Desulfovibrio sp. Fe33 TaxID=3020842 RepID=UPI00234D1E2F|nr:permease-like cell division protein FtsX [Desulfovibrio sp. Fe33]